MYHHHNLKYWEMDFVPSIDPTSDLWKKRNSKSDSNRFWKTASRALLYMPSSPKSSEDGNRLFADNGVIISILGWHGCQEGGAESLKPTWFCFSPWLETIHSQDTFLSCEGWEKWKGKSGSGKYLALNITYKSAKTPELPRLLSKLSSELGLLCMSIKLLCLICYQVPRSSRPHKTHLRICHPARPYKPIAPLFMSGLLRFYQGIFLLFQQIQQSKPFLFSGGFWQCFAKA